MEKTIQERLDNIIKQIDQSIDVNDLNEFTDLLVDYNFDSLSIISLIVEIEEEFKIQYPDEYLVLDEMRYYSKLLQNIEILLDKK